MEHSCNLSEESNDDKFIDTLCVRVLRTYSPGTPLNGGYFAPQVQTDGLLKYFKLLDILTYLH